MRTWKRAEGEIRCGSCRQAIVVDQPMLVIRAVQGWTKFRCAACAGEPVAIDLAPPADRTKRVEAVAEAAERRFTGAVQPALGLDGDV